MSEPIPTPRLQEILEAAERVDATNYGTMQEIRLMDKYRELSDPTTIAALAKELIARRSHDPQPRKRTA